MALFPVNFFLTVPACALTTFLEISYLIQRNLKLDSNLGLIHLVMWFIFDYCGDVRGMHVKPLRVLVCGGDFPALQKVAQKLSDEGVKVETTTQIIDQLCRPNQEWDLLLVDVNGLTSVLRGLLPAIRLQFPNLSVLGVSDGSVSDLGYLSDLELDGYMLALPRPEDLIVRVPRLAANYLCDAKTLSVFDRQSGVA
jgi:hypothetical protein